MMRSQRDRFLLTFILVMLSAAGAAAQEFRATIRGQVLDSSKAALPGVTVTAQNIDTNEMAKAVSNPQGNYTIPFLRPGSYTLTADLQGFQKYTRSGLVLEVNQTATINVQLALGGLTEEVNVTAESPLLETSNASRGTVIDNKRIAELPLQSRNPFALSVLVAGVNYNAQAIYLRPFDNGALADWSMNGGQNRNNEFLLDGAPNNANQGGNNIAYVPPADAVQEFKISTNSYDAQYGRTAGGVVNVSLKSGTNSFHGSVYDYMRRKALAANSFLLNSRNAPKTDQYIDQYGFSVDGPIFKNKTFFMFNGERYREGTPAPLISDVPTPAMKNGDFSGLVDAQGRLITIYDPATGRDVNGVWTRDPFPNNIIPANRISPVARAMARYFPDPNHTTAGVAPWQDNLDFSEHFNKDVFWNWVGKVDHNFSPNDRVFFRWGENERNEIRNTSAIRTGPAQDGQLPLIRANRAIVGDWVRIFGSSTVLNLRSSYTYYLELSRSDAALGFDPDRVRLAVEPRLAVPGRAPRRHVPAHRHRPVRAALARHEPADEQDLYVPAERVDDPRKAQRARRHGHPADERLPGRLRERRGRGHVRSPVHAPHLEQQQRVRGERVRVVSARRAGRRQRAGERVPASAVDVRGPLDPGRLARLQQADAEPGLPVGFQQSGRGGAEPAQLDVRHDARQSGVSAGRPAGAGRRDVRRPRWPPRQPVEIRQEQLSVPCRRRLSDQRPDRSSRRLRTSTSSTRLPNRS